VIALYSRTTRIYNLQDEDEDEEEEEVEVEEGYVVAAAMVTRR